MPQLYTIGHSNRTIEEFLEILDTHNISTIVDVRSSPYSQHLPWFNKENLSQSLKQNQINYIHAKELGGRRAPKKNSLNTGWLRSGFRGYADYMQTGEFFNALKKLNQLVKQDDRIAIMCTEAVPWRCHRSIISDAEIVRGVQVHHILSKTDTREHELTSFAVVDDTTRPIRIYYPSKNLTFPM